MAQNGRDPGCPSWTQNNKMVKLRLPRLESLPLLLRTPRRNTSNGGTQVCHTHGITKPQTNANHETPVAPARIIVNIFKTLLRHMNPTCNSKWWSTAPENTNSEAASCSQLRSSKVSRRESRRSKHQQAGNYMRLTPHAGHSRPTGIKTQHTPASWSCTND